MKFRKTVPPDPVHPVYPCLNLIFGFSESPGSPAQCRHRIIHSRSAYLLPGRLRPANFASPRNWLDRSDAPWHLLDMPLRATVDGKELLAPLLSDDEWEELRTRCVAADHPLILPCCDEWGHCRRSKLGTRHFVHHRQQARCSWPPETEQHLLAKATIVQGCREAGFEARPEHQGDGWRADVLASKSSVKIAFEVQWSTQTAEETQLRQARYQATNVRCCWFFRKMPSTLGPQKEIPAFELFFEGRARL